MENYPIDARGYTDTPGAAKYTGLSQSFLTKARHYGNGPAFVKIGSAVRYSYPALDRFMTSKVRTGTKP